MNSTEQGVRRSARAVARLIRILLLPILSATCIAHAEIMHENEEHEFLISISYSQDSTLQSNISHSLSRILSSHLPDTIITTTNIRDKKNTASSEADFHIFIGNTGRGDIKDHPQRERTLYIATDPGAFRLDTDADKKNAVLYMTQSYCMQLHLIKLLNDQWQTIGFLSRAGKIHDTGTIQRCASKYGLEMFKTNSMGEGHLTDEIKKTLDHSDALLALPDKAIYNSKTVKNILLTSYRYRKPVIAFSKNFVSAGALASIYSSPEQIAETASDIIIQYFKNGQQFSDSINYPQDFDISINRQVFRALHLVIPDTIRLKKILYSRKKNNAGETQ
ncbi:MAG TPA: hypothetical protein ENJ87_06270 [Gammaproteobacteria bacterium]|nr:hypothetical protein [Gammaproteobacteria bacterium]